MVYELTLIGLLISLLYISVTRYYPGGIIVPSYLVMFVDQPYRLLGTFLASLLTLAIYRLASRYMILFGKRRFVLMVLFGGLISLILSYILPFMFPVSIELRVIGWVIPGLIANNFDRQGVVITTSSMAIVIAATFFAGKLYFFLI
ncbi:MAG TPA: poly-gamma-glutamate biosynthesis protein PgsC [Bacteroidales bacterium]|nr:poly-gamma-glutamate biosynthesis protein PgsC [Bacteroidales bacterium]